MKKTHSLQLPRTPFLRRSTDGREIAPERQSHFGSLKIFPCCIVHTKNWQCRTVSDSQRRATGLNLWAYSHFAVANWLAAFHDTIASTHHLARDTRSDDRSNRGALIAPLAGFA
jgi:hypothetical protein